MTIKYFKAAEQPNSSTALNTHQLSQEPPAVNALLFSRRTLHNNQNGPLQNLDNEQLNRPIENHDNNETSYIEKYGVPFAQACTIL